MPTNHSTTPPPSRTEKQDLYDNRQDLSAAGETASYRYLKNMLDSIADPIFVKDRSHRWIDGNQAFWDLMGGPAENFIGKSDFEIFPQDEAEVFWEKDNLVFETGKPTINEEFFTDPNTGKRRVLSTTKTVFPNERGEIVLVGVIRDITMQKELEALQEQQLKAVFYQQLEEKVVELQRSNHELSRFTWLASHDLQEPLRTVAIYLELLQKQYRQALDERAKEYIQTTIAATRRLQRLIEDLLVHARLEKAPDVLEVEFENLVFEVLRDLQQTVEESGAKIDVAPLPTLYGDPILYGRIFQNLISNAIKFRTGNATPKIHIRAEQKGHFWQFSVHDNGIGIAPEHQQHIFDYFARLFPESVYPGSGIGLATCKKIVELYGGKIWVESAPGEGSSFYFTLPD